MTDIPSGTDLSKVPMRANPSGAPPDFEHGPNLIRAVQGVGVSLAVVTTVFLATRLRIYTRLNRGLVLDDGEAQDPRWNVEVLTKLSLFTHCLCNGARIHRTSKHFETTLQTHMGHTAWRHRRGLPEKIVGHEYLVRADVFLLESCNLDPLPSCF